MSDLEIELTDEDTKWIKTLPNIKVYKKFGRRYVGLYKKDKQTYLIESTLIIQLAFFRLWLVLDTMDSTDKIERSITNLSTKEVNSFLDQSNLIDFILRDRAANYFFPSMNALNLILGTERVVNFYTGLRHPTHTIEGLLSKQPNIKSLHLYLARIIDYFIYDCIKDPSYTGTLDLSKHVSPSMNKPPLRDIL